MNASEQIERARTLGVDAARDGKVCVPAHDPMLMKMLEGRQIGVTPPGEASSVAIMQAWQVGFVSETLGAWDAA